MAHADEPAGSGLPAERHDVLDLEVDGVADPHRVAQALLAYLDRRALHAEALADERARAAIGPPSAPEKTAASFAACSSEAAASMKTPRRQSPSLITFGVSAMAATVRPLMSVPSTSPLWTLNTSVTLQRSFVAPNASDAVQGQITSHEHVSKYEPSSFQDISTPKDEGAAGREYRRGEPGLSTVRGTSSRHCLPML